MNQLKLTGGFEAAYPQNRRKESSSKAAAAKHFEKENQQQPHNTLQACSNYLLVCTMCVYTFGKVPRK